MENNININEIEALITLLDDIDKSTFDSVQQKIIELGEDTIPYL